MQSIFILSVMNGAAWGGSEELWYRSALWLVDNSYQVGVCCFDWPAKKEKLEALEAAGCKLYLLPGKSQTKTITGKWKLRKAFKKIPFSNYQRIIVNQGGWKDITSYPFKDLYKTLPVYCLCFHNYDTNEKLSLKKKMSLQNWIGHAQVNLAASEKIFKTITENLGIKIPNQKIFINPVTFQPPEQPLPYLSIQNKIVMVMLAILDTKRKAQDILIQALSKEKWKQRNWELHLYGTGDDYVQLENIILTHNLQSKVFLKGFTNTVKDVIASSHLVLQVTHKDAMPISVMEAMAIGRPVIVSNVGDMPAWIKHNENGWIVNKTDIDAIDETLEMAWSNKNQWELMGKKAFEVFHNRYPAGSVNQFLYQCECSNSND